MSRTNNAPSLPRPARRGLCLLLALCLLCAAAPCADLDGEAGCELCDQDELVADAAGPTPEVFAFLLGRGTSAPLAAPAMPSARIPHPPTF